MDQSLLNKILENLKNSRTYDSDECGWFWFDQHDKDSLLKLIPEFKKRGYKVEMQLDKALAIWKPVDFEMLRRNKEKIMIYQRKE